MKKCFHCGKTLTLDRKVTRRETCPFCGWDLHVCLNCRFFDLGVYNQCREPQAERVLDKERSNFCDYFVYREESTTGAHTGGAARKKIEDLFKNNE